jgi:hypothetical protein
VEENKRQVSTLPLVTCTILMCDSL